MENAADIIKELRAGLQSICEIKNKVEDGEIDEFEALDDIFDDALSALYRANELGLQ